MNTHYTTLLTALVNMLPEAVKPAGLIINTEIKKQIFEMTDAYDESASNASDLINKQADELDVLRKLTDKLEQENKDWESGQKHMVKEAMDRHIEHDKKIKQFEQDLRDLTISVENLQAELSQERDDHLGTVGCYQRLIKKILSFVEPADEVKIHSSSELGDLIIHVENIADEPDQALKRLKFLFGDHDLHTIHYSAVTAKAAADDDDLPF